ncbi:hypothetical protein M3J09_011654 [Ascochyta lentis]
MQFTKVTAFLALLVATASAAALLTPAEAPVVEARCKRCLYGVTFSECNALGLQICSAGCHSRDPINAVSCRINCGPQIQGACDGCGPC